MRQHDRQGRFIRTPVEDRFWEKVDKTKDCWLWTGDINSAGYGRITDYWQKILVHRFSYELAHGPIPEGMVILHLCDVKLCVRPEHLKVGTYSDNMKDAIAKGRWEPGAATRGKPGRRGTDAPRAKLTDDDIYVIRGRYAAGQDTVRGLAAEFKVSSSLIHAIVTHKIWTHI